jgi:hypothetical protein
MESTLGYPKNPRRFGERRLSGGAAGQLRWPFEGTVIRAAKPWFQLQRERVMTWREARQRPLPDAEIVVGGEVS